MTYEGMLCGTVYVTIPTLDGARLSDVLTAEHRFFPVTIPVGSTYCNTTLPHNAGRFDHIMYRLRGCFVVNGQKKNIVSFEMPATNLPVFLANEEGFYSEIRSSSRQVLGPVDVSQTQYSNVVFMKRHVLMFTSRSFRANRTKSVTLVNVLMNLGLTTEAAIRTALLGVDPTPELEQALARTLTNPDDFPLPEDPRTRFGMAPASLVSHLGRKSAVQSEVVSPDKVESVLEREILPHCGGAEHNDAKVLVLCNMARRVALASYRAMRGETEPVDNRDDLRNKCIKGYADLMIELFTEAMKTIRERVHSEVRGAEKQLKQTVPLTPVTFPSVSMLPFNLPDAMKTIGNGQISARMRGKRAAKARKKEGLTQSFGHQKNNIADDIACLRSFKNPVNPQSKQESIRHVQPSAYGYYCPTETREGQDVGLDHAMSLQATTTLFGEVQYVMAVVEIISGELEGVHPIVGAVVPPEMFVLFVNGMPVRILTDSAVPEFVAQMRAARRNATVHVHMSVTVGAPYGDGREVHIRTNAGRLSAFYLIINPETQMPYAYDRFVYAVQIAQELAPGSSDTIEGARAVIRASGLPAVEISQVLSLLDYSNDDLLLPKDILFRGKAVSFPAAAEWIDVFEQANIELAATVDEVTETTTHMAVHPSLFLGSAAAEVPFPDHNQSPRNAYQCGMGKQAIAGRQLSDVIEGAIPPYLLYPQRPLARTEFTRVMQEHHPCPTGFNGVVAIMSYLGNQEDAIVVNRDSVQRGMGVTMHFETYTEVAQNSGGQVGQSQERFGIPTDKVCQGTVTGMRFEHIDESGVAIVGSHIRDGDPLIVKLRDFRSDTHKCRRTETGLVCPCTSMMVAKCFSGSGRGETAVVDRVQTTTNATGDTLVNVVVRYVRTPNVGDKLASRHGQKGTIGRVVAREDLPFNRDGISPDIIINPHAIPSRMTVAHLIETLAGMFSCVTGEDTDATCFQTEWTVDRLCAALKEHGYQPECEEVLTCGMTGEMIEGSVFMGPIFYQRLKQMPVEKAHARAKGKIVAETRQPHGGRSKNGGFRLGEMEKDCVTSHGASHVIQERFTISSDLYKVYVCDLCHQMCIGNADERHPVFKCNTCGNADVAKMSVVELPYAGKLLVQENIALRVGTELVTENALALKAASAGGGARRGGAGAGAGAGAADMEE
jgi:DNA-directed RNA polymerase II subunit RPB2